MPGINKLGNTSSVINTKVGWLPSFPIIKQRNAGRVVTKHFANLTYALPYKYISLLSFLIYQSGADNTIQYNSKLNELYGKAVELSRQANKYPNATEISSSKPTFRNQFREFIRMGLVLPTAKEAVFMIHPAITYNRIFMPKKHRDVILRWINEADKQANISLLNAELIKIASNYIQFVENEMSKHHKNDKK